MALERCSGRFFLVALSGLALSACSPSASTAVPPAANTVSAPASTAPAPVVTGLPDFTGLVERYGPAVVNVQVVGRAAQYGSLAGARARKIPSVISSAASAFPTSQPASSSRATSRRRVA